MGGEHWDSKSGDKVRKTKDSYVRIVYPEEPKALRTIVTKEELKRDPELFQFVDRWAKEKKVGCVLCGKVDTTELVTSPYIYTFEVYNWEKPGTETEFEVHREACPPEFPQFKHSPLGIKVESLKMLGKNPTFTPTITCHVADVCKFFSPTKQPSPYNCNHIAVKWGESKRKPMKNDNVQVTFDPVLYCKRGHPGEYEIGTEPFTKSGVRAYADLIVASKLTKARRSIQDSIQDGVQDMLNGSTVGKKLVALARKDPVIAEGMYIGAVGVEKMLRPIVPKEKRVR